MAPIMNVTMPGIKYMYSRDLPWLSTTPYTKMVKYATAASSARITQHAYRTRKKLVDFPVFGSFLPNVRS